MKINGQPDGPGRDPVLKSIKITKNNTYTPPTGVDGYNKITVNVEGANLEYLDIYDNGIYSPSEGFDGFSSVNVQVAAGGYTEEQLTTRDFGITSLSNNAGYVGNLAFANMGIQSINLPNATRIGDEAFLSCPITSIDCPNVTEIGYNAFSYTQISRVDDTMFPSVTGMANCFANCGNLTEVDLPNFSGVLQDAVFDWCTNLQRVNMPNVNRIGNYCFNNGYSLSDVNVEYCTEVGSMAFGYTQVEELTFKNRCEFLGEAFQESHLRILRLTYGDGVCPAGDGLFGWDDTPPYLEHIYVPAHLVENYKVAQGWSRYADYISSEVKPELEYDEVSRKMYGNVTEVTDEDLEAFASKYGITPSRTIWEIDLPYCTSIPTMAFDGWSKLTTINFPSLTSIPERAFRDTGINPTLTIPPKVTYIGESAFAHSGSTTSLLTEVIITNLGFVTGSTGMFPTSVTRIEVPFGKGDEYRNDESWYDYSTRIVEHEIPAYEYDAATKTFQGSASTLSKSKINTYVGDNEIDTINFPNVTTLNANLLESRSFKTANFPGVTTVKTEAFLYAGNCEESEVIFDDLTTLNVGREFADSHVTRVIAPNLTEIRENAFVGSRCLREFVGENVVNIGREAFQYTALEEFNGPNVVNIGYRAFEDLTSDHFTFYGAPTGYIQEYAFNNAHISGMVELRCTSLGNWAYGNNPDLTGLDIRANQVIEVNWPDEDPFAGCGITEIIFHDADLMAQYEQDSYWGMASPNFRLEED